MVSFFLLTPVSTDGVSSSMMMAGVTAPDAGRDREREVSWLESGVDAPGAESLDNPCTMAADVEAMQAEVEARGLRASSGASVWLPARLLAGVFLPRSWFCFVALSETAMAWARMIDLSTSSFSLLFFGLLELCVVARGLYFGWNWRRRTPEEMSTARERMRRFVGLAVAAREGNGGEGREDRGTLGASLGGAIAVGAASVGAGAATLLASPA